MTKTARMLALERQWGRPIEEIMVAVYSQMGFTGACRALRISVNTLSRWEQVLCPNWTRIRERLSRAG